MWRSFLSMESLCMCSHESRCHCRSTPDYPRISFLSSFHNLNKARTYLVQLVTLFPHIPAEHYASPPQCRNKNGSHSRRTFQGWSSSDAEGQPPVAPIRLFPHLSLLTHRHNYLTTFPDTALHHKTLLTKTLTRLQNPHSACLSQRQWRILMRFFHQLTTNARFVTTCCTLMTTRTLPSRKGYSTQFKLVK